MRARKDVPGTTRTLGSKLAGTALAVTLIATACGGTPQESEAVTAAEGESTSHDAARQQTGSATVEGLSGQDECDSTRETDDHELGLTYYGDSAIFRLVEGTGADFLNFLEAFPATSTVELKPADGRFETRFSGVSMLVSDVSRERAPVLVKALSQEAAKDVEGGIVLVSQDGDQSGWAFAFIAVDTRGDLHHVGICNPVWVDELDVLAEALSDRAGEAVTPVEALRRLHAGEADAARFVFGDDTALDWSSLNEWERAVRPELMDSGDGVDALVTVPTLFTTDLDAADDNWLLCTRIRDFAWGDCTQTDGVPVWAREGSIIEIWRLPQEALSGVPDRDHPDSAVIAELSADELIRLGEANALVEMVITKDDVELRAAEVEPIESSTEPEAEE